MKKDRHGDEEANLAHLQRKAIYCKTARGKKSDNIGERGTLTVPNLAEKGEISQGEGKNWEKSWEKGGVMRRVEGPMAKKRGKEKKRLSKPK